MAFSIRDPLLAKIKDKASIIAQLILSYPKLLEEWEIEQENKFRNEAKEIAEGDNEIESSIYRQLISTFDDDEDLRDVFYQSMLLMSVSYYESMVNLLSKEAKTKDLILAICAKRNITLSPEVLSDIEYIDDEVMALRNNICHNNSGTPRKTDLINRIANSSEEISFTNDVISITGPNYILDVLKKEVGILTEIAKKLGHKNKLYSNGKTINLE